MAPAEGSVLSALLELERAELEKYCESITVDGVIAQTARFGLREGQTAWLSRGALLSYNEPIEWTLRVPGSATKALGRMLSGGGLALVHVRCTAAGGEIVIGANQPGRLATWDLDRGPIVCTSGSFVGAVGQVDIDVTMARRPGAAFFGGAGLFLQRLSGSGIALVHGSGDFIEKTLAPGEKLLVSTGNLAVFSAEVGYDVRGVGGCRKMLFGGEGIFMTELTGPGWVMLQSLKKVAGGQPS